VDLNPNIIHAPTPPAADAAPSIERVIGELIAGIACLIAQGLGEFKCDSRMSADTKRRGSEIISLLLKLRQATAGELDFDLAARTMGTRVLRERDSEISDAIIDTLITAASDITHKIARLRLS
jgi:hypothetical protein